MQQVVHRALCSFVCCRADFTSCRPHARVDMQSSLSIPSSPRSLLISFQLPEMREQHMTPLRNNEDVDRPRQETTGAFMSIDRGNNQLHYMKPPYAPHVQLSLDRGARSGMDTCSRRTETSTACNVATSPRLFTKNLEWAHTRAAAPTCMVPSRYKMETMTSRSMTPRSVSPRSMTPRMKNDTGVKDPDRPRQETIGAFMSIDRGSNQLHYMKPPYAPHVQLSLDRGARSGMDICSRRLPGH